MRRGYILQDIGATLETFVLIPKAKEIIKFSFKVTCLGDEIKGIF